jgi:hypothetical protein
MRDACVDRQRPRKLQTRGLYNDGNQVAMRHVVPKVSGQMQWACGQLTELCVSGTSLLGYGILTRSKGQAP